MKKIIYLLAAALFLIGLAACAAQPQETPMTAGTTPPRTASASPSTTVTTAVEIQDAGLYEAFLASKQWKLMEDGAGDLVEWDFELTAHKIFDFDGDGVDELWLEASEPGGFDKFSGFYAIEDAQVKELLSGYITGGSIGGDEVAMFYDTQTKQHLVSVVGYAGGFGGNASYGTYYEYKNGHLREVLDLKLESLFEREPVYEIDGEQVTEAEYNQALARMTEPTDKTFLLEGTPASRFRLE